MFHKFQDRVSTFLVLRYEKNGSLFDVMKRMGNMTIECAQGIVTEVVLGLHVLYVNNIIHADLKPENILFDANLRAHVADFGLSISTDPRRQLVGKWGTAAFQSPEQIDGKTIWDHRVDYFSLGVIFLIMTTGQHPFDDGRNDNKIIQDNVAKMNFKAHMFESAVANSFVRHTVCRQNNRFHCMNILQHPFISSIIRKVNDTYNPAVAVTFDDGLKFQPFYDNVNLFEPYQGVSFEYEEEEKPTLTQIIEKNDAAVMEIMEHNDEVVVAPIVTYSDDNGDVFVSVNGHVYASVISFF